MNREDKKKKLLGFMNHPDYKPMKIRDIMVLLGVQKEERFLLEDLLSELINEGKIVQTKRGKYTKPEEVGLLTGTFEGNQGGYGFVVLDDDPEAKDIFIPKDCVNDAMHKDKVLCQIVKPEANGKRCEGEIVQIIERGKNEIVGTFQHNKSFGFVVPDDAKYGKDIFISKKLMNGAKTGHKVVCKIVQWPKAGKKPEGRITEILGHVSDPTTEILAVVRQYEIPVEFPEAVERQINGIAETVTEKESRNREDIRHIQMVTIDGADAKDLDDAITLEKLDNGRYTLGVHIADVTHYVRENTALDQEAYKRGTSVYLVDRVIPMLPRKLSNGICSLNAGVDRLALSCFMEVDETGQVKNHRITETLIHVDERMTYDDVKKILVDEDEDLIERYKDFVPFFKNMEDLAQILRNKRTQRGSIDFDFEEAKIYLDDKGIPVEIKPYERSVATRIIEEFMLLCNETVAEDYYWQDVPFLYRSHEEPDPERILGLSEFIYNFGYSIKGKHGTVHPKAMQKVLDDIAGTAEEPIISRLVLRSMKQAKYTATSEGHFGLAAKYYSHFTSPIRRYPDLQIHRIIKKNLNGKMEGKYQTQLSNMMPEIAKHCSMNERRAEEAERETEKLMKVRFMEDKLGQIFDGVISSITKWGMYVELPNTIEGLVHVSNMDDDYYVYDDKLHVFVGERTKRIYRLGDRVKVKLIDTDVIRKTIDFIVIESIASTPSEEEENID